MRSLVMLVCPLLAMVAWGADCGPIPTDYAVYSGQIADVDNNVRVNGNLVTPGTSGNAIATDGSRINDTLALPGLDPPSFPANGSTAVADENDSPFDMTGEVYYDEILINEGKSASFAGGGAIHINLLEVEKNATISLAAGTYYVSTLDMGQNAEIVASGGPVILHIGAALQSALNADFNTAGNVEDLRVYLHQDATLDVDDGVDFVGVVLGPDSGDASIGRVGNFTGIFAVGGNVTIARNTRFVLSSADAATIGLISTCAPPPSGGGGIDHFVLSHSGSGIHCLDEAITVTAKDASGNTLTDFAEAVVLDTQSGRGTFSLLTGAGSFADTMPDDGLASYNFALVDNGVASFALSYPEGVSPIDVDVELASDSGVRDDGSEGLLVFAPSGFAVTANPLSNPPPSPINDPVGPETAGSNFNVHITAFGVTDDDPVCGIIESYGGGRPLEFWMSYDDPGSGTLLATVDTIPVATSAATASSQPVTFTAGQASVVVEYKDVGAMSLNVQDEASFVNMISGATGSFVVRPDRLVISRVTTSLGVDNVPTTSETGPRFVPAGEAFVVEVEARDADDDVVPNFGLESSAERIRVVSEVLVLPGLGRNGSTGDVINGASFAVSATPGRQVNNSILFDEVGIIQLRPYLTDDDYLGTGTVAGTLGSEVGRFYPARFELTSSNLSAQCGSFSYMDQPGLQLDYELEAQTTLGAAVENYDSDFYTSAALADVVHLAEAANDGINRGGRLSAMTTDWQDGVVTVSEPTLAFARIAAPDGPFDPLQLGLATVDPLGDVVLNGLDMNAGTSGDCVLAANCNARGLSAATRVVYGRLLVLPGMGPENVDLDLGLRAHLFNGTAFTQHGADNCSSYTSTLASLNPATYTGNLNAGETAPTTPVASTTLINGVADATAPLTLSAPGFGNDGSVLLILDVPSWLEFDWNGTGLEDPGGTATFGRFRGHDRIIFWTEQ